MNLTPWQRIFVILLFGVYAWLTIQIIGELWRTHLCDLEWNHTQLFWCRYYGKGYDASEPDPMDSHPLTH